MRICNEHRSELVFDDNESSRCPACVDIESALDEVGELEISINDLEKELDKAEDRITELLEQNAELLKQIKSLTPTADSTTK